MKYVQCSTRSFFLCEESTFYTPLYFYKVFPKCFYCFCSVRGRRLVYIYIRDLQEFMYMYLCALRIKSKSGEIFIYCE